VGQSPTATVWPVDLANFVLYYPSEASDISKYATNPGPTPSVVPKNFYVETLLADVVAVNGQPAKGLYAARGQTIVTSPTPAPGSAVVGQPFPASPLQVVNSPVEVLVNGKDAEVLAATGYPGAADGYQVNFRVPADASGTVTIQVSAAWIPGNLVSIPVQ
jgi:hypothetical protein